MAKSEYNKLPKNLEKISQETFLKELMLWAWPVEDFRQPTRGMKFLGNMKIWKQHSGDGIACLRSGDDFKFYKVADCKHRWKVTHSSRCYTESMCDKCGTTKSLDTSG